MTTRRKKRGTSLPRVTVMAYRRKDLVEFVQAVETLRLLVQDLRVIAEGMKRTPKRATTQAKAASDLLHTLADVGKAGAT